MMGEKVLITGCNGFIGSHLTARLLKEGYHVTGIDLLPPEKAQNIGTFFSNPLFSYIEGDVTDKVMVDKAIDHTVSKVYHLAALVGIERYMERPLDVVRTNVLGTLNILDAALRHQCYLFYSSTSEVYGKNPNVPWQEDDDRVLGSTSFERWSYSSSKAAAEHAVVGAFKQQKLNGCIVRFFNVYGPKQSDAFVISRNLKRAADGQNLLMHNTGEQTRCFTYIDDAIDACMALSTAGNANGEVFNIGAEVGDAFEDIMRRVPCLKKINNTIGWEATTNLHNGLSKTYQWLMDNK